MPYRRLPNTDTSRIRSMKIAFEKGKEFPPQKLAFTSKTFYRLQKFLPEFENGITLKRQSLTSQFSKIKNNNEAERKARTYLSHFIRVMNMAVYRGDLPAETRTYYGLTPGDSTLPSFNTDNELLSWGRRIIEGEEFRIKKGGSPITNPTIAVVKVRFETFLSQLNHYQTLNKLTNGYAQKNNELRIQADELILAIWNEVEAHFSDLPEGMRRIECEKYGLIYFFRKGEVKRSDAIEEKSSVA